jgi:2-polyprenyl-3-methyl-5-hydroxy-6-metoxy-1,4-benzoquinol methylase
MDYANFYKTNGHSFDEYDASHAGRLDALVSDLHLNDLKGKVADIGCGIGFLHKRLCPEVQENYYGFDGAEVTNMPFKYRQVDLDNFTKVQSVPNYFDTVLCFETLEHLTNPYDCLLAIKNILKPNGKLVISIPEISTTHNTIYPGLLYPVKNFLNFLGQMAFQVVDHRVHRVCFSQEIITVINKGWDESKMLFKKTEEKFKSIPPHISINL